MVLAGANIHADEDKPLRVASLAGHLPVVEYLVSMGADIHTNNARVFRIAIKSGHLPVVEYLISMGTDIHADDDSAIKMAFDNNRADIIYFLIRSDIIGYYKNLDSFNPGIRTIIKQTINSLMFDIDILMKSDPQLPDDIIIEILKSLYDKPSIIYAIKRYQR